MNNKQQLLSHPTPHSIIISASALLFVSNPNNNNMPTIMQGTKSSADPPATDDADKTANNDNNIDNITTSKSTASNGNTAPFTTTASRSNIRKPHKPPTNKSNNSANDDYPTKQQLMNTISKFRQKQRKQSKNLTPKNYDSSQTTQTRGTSATTPLNETAGPFGKGTTAANNDLNEQHNSTSSNIPPLAKCTEEGVDKGLTSNEAKNQCQDGSDGNGQDGADSNNDGEDPTNEQDGEDKPSQDAEPPKGDEGGENQSNNSTKYKGIASSDAKDQKGEEIPSKENPSKQCTENAAGTHSDTKTSNGDGGARNQSKNSANNEGGGTSSASKDTPSNNGDNTVLNALIDQTLINRAQEATTDQTTQEANIVHLANSTINDSASDHNVQAPTTPTTKKGNSSSSSRRKQFRGVQVKLDAIT